MCPNHWMALSRGEDVPKSLDGSVKGEGVPESLDGSVKW